MQPHIIASNIQVDYKMYWEYIYYETCDMARVSDVKGGVLLQVAVARTLRVGAMVSPG